MIRDNKLISLTLRQMAIIDNLQVKQKELTFFCKHIAIQNSVNSIEFSKAQDDLNLGFNRLIQSISSSYPKRKVG